jgi:hypothetical protein
VRGFRRKRNFWREKDCWRRIVKEGLIESLHWELYTWALEKLS